MGLTKRLGAIFGVAVSVVLLLWLFSQLDWAVFFVEASKLRFWCIPVVFLCMLLSFWLRAVRWRLLLPTSLELSTYRLFNALVLGTLASFVLPLRAGEFVRPWVLSRAQPVSFSMGFASVVTERVFDVLMMLLFLIACLTQIPKAPELVIIGAKALGVFAGVILLAMIVAYLKSNWLLRILENTLALVFNERARAFQEKFLGMSREFIAGLRAISSFQELLLVVFWSALIWALYAVGYYVNLAGFSELPSFWVAITLTVMIALAVAAPSAPGFLGTYQLGCVAALQFVYGFSEEFALAYSVVSHAIQFVSIVLMGLFALRAEGIGLFDLREHSQQR